MQNMIGIVEADGMKMPVKRRAYRADDRGAAIPDQLMVAIDFSDVRVTASSS